MNTNYPIVTFASDTNIAKEGRRDLYMFAIGVIFILCGFQFMQSDAYLELSRDYKNSKAATLKFKKAQLEKELAEMGEK